METTGPGAIVAKTIDEINDKVDFNQAFRMSDLLYVARSYLNNGVADDLERLANKLDEVSEGYDDEDDSIFDLADGLESEIMQAQERLEAIYDVLSSITDCWPDPDEEYEEEYL